MADNAGVPVGTAKAPHRRLFQAALWRDYAKAWDRPNQGSRVGREWMKHMGMPDKAECIRRAKEALSHA